MNSDNLVEKPLEDNPVEKPLEKDGKVDRKPAKRIWLFIGIAILVVPLIVWGVLRKGTQKAQSQSNQASTTQTPTVAVTTIVSQELNRQVRLPGELQAYQDVAIYPKVQGFVEWIGVDRGSTVKAGQLLARLSAPEIAAQRSEAGAKVRSAQSLRVEAEARIASIRAQRVEAEAKFAADEATYSRLKAASATPGVVAGNDVNIAEKTVEADRARIKIYDENEKAARAQMAAIEETTEAYQSAARSVQDMQLYLQITAPFGGVITERNVHKGSLVGALGATAAPMLRIRQVSKLRLVVAVPEADVSGISEGEKINFTVPAFPGQTFVGEVKRVADALDVKTRTMPVELDVSNSATKISPGMYAEVVWNVRRGQSSLFVPPSAVASTTEKTFVIRIRNEVAEWVEVRRGEPMGNLIEVFGELAAGDVIAVRGTDELRNGTKVVTKSVTDH